MIPVTSDILNEYMDEHGSFEENSSLLLEMVIEASWIVSLRNYVFISKSMAGIKRYTLNLRKHYFILTDKATFEKIEFR